MKKILALLMAVCMMLALLTGCGSAPAETPQTPAEQPVAENLQRRKPSRSRCGPIRSSWS